MPFTGSRGIVSGHTDQFGPELMQIDATVDHGNSGGPVIALGSREVVGIATAGAGGNKADRLNFATPMQDVSRILALLREGNSPSPPWMEFALLTDEDGRQTLRVGATLDSVRWPFAPGDRILTVEGDAGELQSVNDLVSTLRGRTGRVPVRVERAGQPITVVAQPVARSPIVERRGVQVDGALIAPVELECGAALSEPITLIVHSVEPASVAQSLEIQQGDILQSVDGRRFADLASLIAHLEQRPKDTPVVMVLRRWSPSDHRIFEYHHREIPGASIQPVGPQESLTAADR